jgi:Arc-like DNA binding domain
MAKRRRRSGRAQLKVRLPEPLRREIEGAAAQRGHSMNTEIVERLLVFDKTRDAKKLVAQALLDTLDDEIIRHIVAEAKASGLTLTPGAWRPRRAEEMTEKDSVVLNLIDELRKQIKARPRPTGEATETAPPPDLSLTAPAPRARPTDEVSEKDSVVLNLMDEIRKLVGPRPRPTGEATEEDSRKRGTRK